MRFCEPAAKLQNDSRRFSKPLFRASIDASRAEERRGTERPRRKLEDRRASGAGLARAQRSQRELSDRHENRTTATVAERAQRELDDRHTSSATAFRRALHVGCASRSRTGCDKLARMTLDACIRELVRRVAMRALAERGMATFPAGREELPTTKHIGGVHVVI